MNLTALITSADDTTRVAAALDYMRRHKHFFEFDDQERVVKVGVSDAANVDEIAAHIGSLRDLQELTFYRTGDSHGQVLQAFHKVEGVLRGQWLSGCRFVPLVGAQDESAEQEPSE